MFSIVKLSVMESPGITLAHKPVENSYYSKKRKDMIILLS
jgi:hypothetical protein